MGGCGRTHLPTYIFQRLDLAQDALDLRVVLALELVEHRIAVLAPAVGRRRPEALVVDAQAAVGLRVASVAVAAALATWTCAGPSAGLVGARVALEEIAARVALVQRRGTESGWLTVSILLSLKKKKKKEVRGGSCHRLLVACVSCLPGGHRMVKRTFGPCL